MDERTALERAATQLEQVLAAHPHAPRPHCLLAVIQEKLGRRPSSIASWRRAHDLAPEDLDIAAGLAVALSRAGLHAEASGVLTRVAKKERRAALRAEAKKPELSGTLARFGVPDLLDFLINQRARGTLHVKRGSAGASLTIWEGRLVGGNAPGVPELVPNLIAAGALSASAWDRAAVGEKDELAHFFGCVLATHRIAPVQAIKAAVELQVTCVLQQMMTWTDGQFVFEDLECVQHAPASVHDVSVDARAVLLDVIRLADENAR